MSKVVGAVVLRHSCSPGWVWTSCPEDSDLFSIVLGGKGGKFGTPPTPWRYPKGTVWECDCGTTWVSTGPCDRYSPGSCGFRREGWFARRRRERRAA